MDKNYNASEYGKLIEIANEKWQAFLSIAKGDLSDLKTIEFAIFKEANDKANKYYKRWQNETTN